MKRTAVLGVGALGVVFGDIGTSPLYVMRTVFTVGGGAVALTDRNILSVVSCIIWLLLLIVTVKYVVFVLRADHDGEGGILALSTLVCGMLKPGRLLKLMGLLGVFGAALFFGDSVITPAISVLSAIEGLEVAFPDMPNVVLPVALAILTALFAIQKSGTSKVGRVFGPLMVVWFIGLALAGLPHVIQNPSVLMALSPTVAVQFLILHPAAAFVMMGAIVLAVTGTEALYADVSHFGRTPIQLTWIGVVLPCLILNYLGQGALLIEDESHLANPFFHLVPSSLTIPLVIMATIATLIASQAVISGAYSIARQASRLGYLPHLRIVHTSESAAGQIYLPAVNMLLYGAVAVVVLVFQDSDRLSGAYGLAVTTDFVITSLLLVVLTRVGWKWPAWATAGLAVGLATIEWPMFAANLSKISTGGWLPLGVALTMMFMMITWNRGERLVTRARKDQEGTLKEFLDNVAKHPVRRIPGTAIYPHSMISTTPRSLKLNTMINHSLHDHVVIVSLKTMPVPRVPLNERMTIDRFESPISGVSHVTLRFGFMDTRDVEETLAAGQKQLGLRSWNLDCAYFMLSHLKVTATKSGCHWWKHGFVLLSRMSASPQWTVSLPASRTAEISSTVTI
ncbi:potassium transporter Kup [Ancrocorticia populi]|uniref:potassium transporter Kup n=1 Tax=Ancrocorticia populi TaxID=2175228 RepID=UPI001FAEFD46|nr:KUP/HAK/KT family potassium transporter [Ancrocorticia populi]